MKGSHGIVVGCVERDVVASAVRERAADVSFDRKLVIAAGKTISNCFGGRSDANESERRENRVVKERGSLEIDYPDRNVTEHNESISPQARTLNAPLARLSSNRIYGRWRESPHKLSARLAIPNGD